MKYKVDFFAESRPINNFKWVLDNCTVHTKNEEQLEFLNSENGIMLMDGLFDVKDKNDYLEIAATIEQEMENCQVSLRVLLPDELFSTPQILLVNKPDVRAY